jgi:hypothetical protein
MKMASPATAASRAQRRGRIDVRRKNLRLDQRKLDQVRRILGAQTETDAIDQALDLVVFQERAAAGMARWIGRGGFRNVFEDDGEP